MSKFRLIIRRFHEDHADTESCAVDGTVRMTVTAAVILAEVASRFTIVLTLTKKLGE